MKRVELPSNNLEYAETIATSALGFLASDQERLERFLSLTGIAAGDIRKAAAQPGFLANVLGHMMQDEELLLAFARESNLKPEAVVRAATALGAGPWERDIP